MIDSAPGTINELFEQAVRLRAGEEVIRYKRDGKWQGIKGAELDERVRNVSLGLRSFGVVRGDRIGIIAESAPEWTIADYGILSCGGITVPIYPTQALDQVTFIIRNSGMKVLFVSGNKLLRRIQTSLENLRKDELPRLVLFEDTKGEKASGKARFEPTHLEDLEREGSQLRTREPGLFRAMQLESDTDDLATIIYTSGTTGEPKGVMLTHRNIVADVVNTGGLFKLQPDDIALSFLPLSHVFERTVLYIYLLFGVQINFARGVETVSEDIKEVRPTIVTAVPRLFERIYSTINKRAAEAKPWQQRVFQRALKVGREYAVLLDKGASIPARLRVEHQLMDRLVFRKWRDAVGGRVRFFLAGGAALSPELAYIFLGAGILILQGYGLTETSPVVAVNTPDANRVGTIGQAIPGVNVRVAEDGELLVQGDIVMQGYYLMAEETERVIKRKDDGVWFHTGDIGTIDADGFIRITDRKKDLIKTSLGKYIAPQPIENSIRAIPMVEQVIVVGNHRKYASALIVPNFEALRAYADSLQLGLKDKSDMVQHPRILEFYKKKVDEVTRELAMHEKIKRVALLDEEFSVEGGELTPTLKVRRKFVEDKHQKMIDSLYPKSEVDI